MGTPTCATRLAGALAAGAGGFGLYQKWDANKDKFGTKVVKVFVTYSEKLPAMIASGEVKV